MAGRYFASKPPYFFDSKVFAKHAAGRDFVVIDGGARDSLFDPFDLVKSNLEIVAFEPDAMAPLYESRLPVTRIQKALWDKECVLDLHLAADPSTSSVYPPNIPLLAQFRDEIGVPTRTTVKVLKVAAISIDRAVETGLCKAPNFIKLDIHSAEYEALRGAADSLRQVVGVLVETWNHPVHKGQHLHSDVESFLNSQGFYMFHLRDVVTWKQCVDGVEFASERDRHVGSEALFFRDSVPPELGIFAIACADLFGYPGYAIALSRRFLANDVLAPQAQKEIEQELRSIVVKREHLSVAYRVARWGWRVAKALLGLN